VPFLIVKSDWRKTNTSPTSTISPSTSNENFEMPILFNVVEKSGNYFFEDEIHPTALSARVVGYALGAYKVL
jgi:phospholipase/lecithinase/hemolysin